jgi:hypothetical protein
MTRARPGGLPPNNKKADGKEINREFVAILKE